MIVAHGLIAPALVPLATAHLAWPLWHAAACAACATCRSSKEFLRMSRKEWVGNGLVHGLVMGKHWAGHGW